MSFARCRLYDQLLAWRIESGFSESLCHGDDAHRNNKQKTNHADDFRPD